MSIVFNQNLTSSDSISSPRLSKKYSWGGMGGGILCWFSVSVLLSFAFAAGILFFFNSPDFPGSGISPWVLAMGPCVIFYGTYGLDRIGSQLQLQQCQPGNMHDLGLHRQALYNQCQCQGHTVKIQKSASKPHIPPMATELLFYCDLTSTDWALATPS